jgi:hypothetical protein
VLDRAFGWCPSSKARGDLPEFIADLVITVAVLIASLVTDRGAADALARLIGAGA